MLKKGLLPIKSGFTLIELLIVIAVLGILAVAVLAAINPIEQINRSRDTGSRSDSEQLISAIDRYYASAGYYPWTDGASSTNTDLGWVEIASENQTFGADAVAMLTNISTSTGELKQSFITRVTQPDYNHLFIYNEGDQGSSTYVCFLPKSKSFLDEAEKRCLDGLPADASAIVGNVCTDPDFYTCLP